MAHVSPDPDPTPPDLLGFLGLVADSFCAAVADGAGGVLLHVTADAEGGEVGVLDLAGRPPADLLIGMVAPDDWVALGVAATGTAHSLDPGPDEGRRVGRTSSAVLVHRSGEVVSRLRFGDEVLHEPPAYGLTLDCLQRALGLPTAPPLEPTAVLFAASWLENVLVAASGRHRALTWAQARSLHPALQLRDPGEPVGRTDDLVEAAEILARICDWDRLRWLVVEGAWRERNLTPTEAAWFDAGAFSRWVLGQRPGIEMLLADLHRVVSPGVARRCTSVLHRLGILRRTAA